MALSKIMKQNGDPISPYRRSSWMILHVANPFLRLFVGRLGFGSSSGFRILKVRGRKSGRWYSVPIRLLELDGYRYLVALQGQTFWVKNLRMQGAGKLQFGGRTTDFTSVELPDQDKTPVLRAYLKRWWSVSKPLTTITSPDATDEEFVRAEPLHPVFLLK
jgi:deazaflavin-dependent oxidoreductase (nitroreductase family)